MATPTVPTYPWFDQVPEHLKTRRQLAEQGLRPGGPVVAQVVWRRGERWADLYDLNTAKPKREMSAAQRAALEKAQQALRTCPACKTVFSFVLYRGFDCPVCFERMLARDRAAAARQARIWLRSPGTVIIDTETTRLDGYLVQIAVIRAHDSAVLLDTLVNPMTPIGAGTRQIHGISDEQVVGAPTFAQIADPLFDLLRGKRIVAYNKEFDYGVLYAELKRRYGPTEAYKAFYEHAKALLRPQRWRCAMELYAQFCGDWSDRHGDYRWQPLPGGDHGALGDARACRAVLAQMAEEFGNVRNQRQETTE